MRTHRVVLGLLVAGSLTIPCVTLVAAAASEGAVLSAHRAAVGPVLPWIDDDLTRAMAEAKARKLPIFVESWAPW
jgi:hypothetical protein